MLTALSWAILLLAGGREQGPLPPPGLSTGVVQAEDCLWLTTLAVDPLGPLSEEVLREVLQELGLVETWVPEEAQTLPEPRYLEHLPQHFPPSGDPVPTSPATGDGQK